MISQIGLKFAKEDVKNSIDNYHKVFNYVECQFDKTETHLIDKHRGDTKGWWIFKRPWEYGDVVNFYSGGLRRSLKTSIFERDLFLDHMTKESAQMVYRVDHRISHRVIPGSPPIPIMVKFLTPQYDITGLKELYKVPSSDESVYLTGEWIKFIDTFREIDL